MKITNRLDQVARSPFPLTIEIIHSTNSRPFALPGGYVFVPLTQIATATDELVEATAHALAHAVAAGAGMNQRDRSAGEA